MNEEASLIHRDTITLMVPIACEFEIRNVAQFQKEGHYVASTVSGVNVHILTYRAQGHQLLRTQGGILADAETAMLDAVPSTLYSLWAQSQIQSETQRQFYILNEQRNKLAEFLWANYSADELPHTGTFEAAVQLLTRERSRLWVRIRRKLFGNRRPPTPPPTPSVDPNGPPANRAEWLG